MSKDCEAKNLSDHDLLIRIDERVVELSRDLAKHLSRHWIIALAAITAAFGAIGTLIVVVVFAKLAG